MIGATPGAVSAAGRADAATAVRSQAESALYIGLMSGTSLDGVDAVLVDFAPAAPLRLQVLGYQSLPFGDALRAELLALNQPGANELHRAALAANAISTLYADAVAALQASLGGWPGPVRAIGAHGQTVRHRPGEFDGIGYTIQLLNGALLAERTGIDTVCDFRSRDVAAGGQGAPLVPAFHAAVLDRPGCLQALLNLGGIANLTLLDGEGGIQGFDCGPANVLMDGWCEQHLGTRFDDGGRWAARGAVCMPLLQRMLAEPYFSRRPPKSTGRDLFHSAWLAQALADSTHADPLSAQDVQATLLELTALSAATALLDAQPNTTRLLVCGGGALNQQLMMRLGSLLPGIDVQPTTTVGLPPLQVEASAFAWLAHAHLSRTAANHPPVTGALGHRILGALYPAR